MKRILAATSPFTFIVVASTSVVAQEQIKDSVEVLSTWAYDPLYADGWSVENMFDETEILGANDEVIGDVENVIFSNDGDVLGIIAEVGGLWDIGDTHINVPWDQVTLHEGIGQISIPVAEENIDDYDVFGDYWDDEEVINEADVQTTQAVDDDLVAGSGIFKATDLVGDYVFLSDGSRYGYVSDLIIQDNEIGAIVIDAGLYGAQGRGYYAYPYEQRNVRTGARYDMSYSAAEIDAIENFDYDQLQSRGMQYE